MEAMIEQDFEKSKTAFKDLINLMNRGDLDEILNSQESNWRNKIANAILAYTTIVHNFDKNDIRRINIEACWFKSIYLAGYEHGKIDSVALIVKSESKP